MSELVELLLRFAVIPLLTLAAPVLAIVLFVRLRQLRKYEARLSRVENELRAMSRRIDAGASAAAISAAASPFAPGAAAPTLAPSAPAAPIPQAPAPVSGAPHVPPIAPPIPATPAAPRAPVLGAPVRREERPAAPSASAASVSHASTSASGWSSSDADRPAGPRSNADLPAAPRAAVETAREASARRSIDWERWIGVRGAAVVGGVALALAAILFFKHAFTHGWISPTARVVSGVVFGIACVVAGQRLRPRGYGFAPAALEGAGVVALYAAIWAARQRYFLISTTVSFPAMAAVTVLGCWLAHRGRSQLVALLALCGGFATPLLLSSGQDRPFGLFGYLLLLDLGLLFLCLRNGWPLIALAALAATTMFQGLWISQRMGPERLALGLSILGVFALLFAFAGARAKPAERRDWALSQGLAILFPFAFALYFAQDARFRGELYPTAILAGLLGAAACWLSRGDPRPLLPIGTASASLALIATWLAHATPFDESELWEFAAVCAALGAIYHVFLELAARRRETPEARTFSVPAFVFSLGALVTAAASMFDESRVVLWPWLVALLVQAALLVRQSVLARSAWPAIAAAAGLSLGLAGYANVHLPFTGDPHPDLAIFFGLAVSLSLIALLLGAALRGSEAARGLQHSSALIALAVLVACYSPTLASVHGPLLFPAGILALALAAALAAAVLGSSGWFAAAVLSTWIAHVIWSIDLSNDMRREAVYSYAQRHAAGAVLFLSAGALALWPLAWRARFASRPWAWRVGGLVAALWFTILQGEPETFLPGKPHILGPLLFGAIAAAAYLWVERIQSEWRARGPALAWYGSTAVVLLALAVPLHLDVEVVATAAALSALGLVALSARCGERGPLALASVAAFLAVSVLGSHAVTPAHYERATALLWNSINGVHAVCAVALLAAGPWAMRLIRRRGFEATGERWFALILSLAGLLVVFLWINLGVLDYFSREERLTYRLERLPARDLTTSIAWIVYSLALLGIGMARRISGLRWASLALLLITLFKVFLYDLGHLQGLYRVGSLAGLAVCALAVSLLYQRFVLGKAAPTEPDVSSPASPARDPQSDPPPLPPASQSQGAPPAPPAPG